jgi:predicted nucleic acid-binding protein
MQSSTRIQPPLRETIHQRGIIDISVVIDLDRVSPTQLPSELAISTVTLAELAAGPHATKDPAERARRQDRLQQAEVTFDPLPVDRDVARAYGRVYAAVIAAGRKAGGRRSLDLLVAATALSLQLPLYTRNVEDFREIDGLVEVVAVDLGTST